VPMHYLISDKTLTSIFLPSHINLLPNTNWKCENLQTGND